MRGLPAAGTIVLMAVAASVGFATTRGTAAPPPTLAQAAARTAQAASQQFSADVHITRAAKPLVLHVRGAAAARAASVTLKLDSLTLPNGTVVPGMTGALMLDGPFLYEKAPSSVAAVGKLRWIRVDAAAAPAGVRSLRELLPETLLRVLGRAQAAQSSGVYSGTLAYDDPVVRSGLAGLTGDIEFRHLHVTAWLGPKGLVSRARITGRTADGSATFALDERLFGFGSAVRVTLPPQDAFLDPAREKIVN